LQPRRYKLNHGHSNRFHTGLIAQEVEEAIINSGLDTQDFAAFIKRGDSYSLRYEEFIALCVHEIQKLKKQVKELESQNKNVTTE
jgi:predicted nuclease with TOPRIM domain